MFNLLLYLSILHYCVSFIQAQDEAEIYLAPGTSAMFLGVDEEVMNITRVFQWEKIDKRSGNQPTTEHVLQFHVGSPKHAVIQKYTGRIHFNPLNGSFLFSNLTSADTGLYRLSINLRTRIIRQVRLWIMERLSKPSIRSNGSSPGATIQLECNVEGDARGYQWQKDGMDIPHPHLIEGNRSLVLLHVARKDCAIYTCTASNPVGSVSAEYILTILGLHRMDIIVIVASSVGITFSITSLVGLLVLCIIRKKLPRGPASVSVVAFCTASVFLVFNLSLAITVGNLGCQCIAGLLDSTGLRAWMDVCGIVSSFLVLVTSIVTLFEEGQQSKQGCYETILTWSIPVPMFIIVVIIFLTFFAVWHTGNDDVNNIRNIDEQPEVMQLNNINPEDEGGN
ncbi:uncharacterized protein LOC129694538 isoform X2 [Leucoraja erinacea]|uniref:uncharacterized protein LOC129694538 isoform X2 n=1 Tax=Leucoraja erinaceus TaxID=7782 RepID=UPI002456572B|nr:uncharacterized protein LOC129694538 isoform X2 [Leucoraja erinacea]